MSLTAVRIAGQDVQCVDLNVNITHGRRTATDGPTASTADLTIYTAAVMPAWGAGDSIEVDAHMQRRFTGTITDVSIVGHTDLNGGPRVAVFTVTAIGAVATLGHRDVGGSPWPVERSAGRARNILTAAGVSYVVEGDPGLRITARDVDRRDALSLVTELAGEVGAAVFDTPFGGVVFQHYSARAQTWNWTRWLEAPGVWSEQDAWFADWDATARQSPSAPLPIPLDACAVGWEPVWRSTSWAIVNSVSLAYGPKPADDSERPVWSVTRPASVARFGRKHYGAETQLADVGSASERAGMILDLHSDPHWGIDNVIVLLDELSSPSDVGLMLDLLCGARVSLPDLPQPAPEWAPVRVVEGWTHSLTATRSTLLLHLSDPLQSYAGVAWSALPASVPRWMDLDPADLWVNALTIADLQTIGAP